MRLVAPSAALIFALSGCNVLEARCARSANLAPAAPEVLLPAPGRKDVIPGVLVISTSAFDDGDPDDVHAESEFEIWRMAGDEPVLRAWRAAVTEPGQLTQVTLADGELEGLEAERGLFEWADYGVRVRYRDHGEGCPQWSEWSELRQFRTDDGSAYLFDEDTIHSVHIGIPPESWDAINAEARPPGCVPHQRSYYPGSLRFEGQVFEGVGVRVKGGCGSARDLDGKSAFKVHLSWNDPEVPGCPEDRRLHGLRRLTLNNMVQDRTFLHERVGYLFYRLMGVPTPRVMHTRVYVNDELWGLYLNVESVDRRFLDRRFDSRHGMLYEGTYFCDLIAANVPEEEAETHCLTRKFRPGPCDGEPRPDADPLTYEPLRQLVAAIEALPDGGFYPGVEDFFDFDTFLSMWAVDSVIAHWDSYQFRIMNNYRVYHDPSRGLWTIIPHGIDQTFIGDQDPFDVHAVLGRRCLAEPACEAAFLGRLAQAVQVFAAADLDGYAQTIREQIAPHVSEDPRREITYEQFERAADDMLTWIAARPERMQQILDSGN